MTKFKVGDRVSVVGGIKDVGGVYHDSDGMKFEVVEFREYADLKLLVKRLDDGCKFAAHPRQCARLVRKERRRVWLSEAMLSGGTDNLIGRIASTEGPCWEDSVEFIEVKPKRGGK